MRHLLRFTLAWMAVAAIVCYFVGWWWYRRYGSAQPRTMTPRDAGLPENIIPPRSHWDFFHARTVPGLYFRIKRRTRQQAREHTSAPYIVKWRSWQLDAVAFTHHVHLSRWSERWAS